MTAKGYTAGTHRLVDPSDTLTRVAPHAAAAGVTRCADVTGLDRLGIPVQCAIRPSGRAIQVSNGKGLRPVDARVSALMEAVELHHAEHPPPGLLRTSLRRLRAAGHPFLHPADLTGFRSSGFFSDDYLIEWVRGHDLLTDQHIWVPASAVHLSLPAVVDFSSNGLASGNDLDEATLHALYEVLERDAVSGLTAGGRVVVAQRCDVIDPASIDPRTGGGVAELVDRVERAGIRVVLLGIPTRAEATTCGAVLLDPRPLAASTAVTVGFGAHLSPSVAACRAITEAAQSRLTFIHGSRDDIDVAVYDAPARARLHDYFARLVPNRTWSDLPDRSGPTLGGDLHRLLDGMRRAGLRNVIRVDLTRAPFDIPVVKVLVPGLTMSPRLF